MIKFVKEFFYATFTALCVMFLIAILLSIFLSVLSAVLYAISIIPALLIYIIYKLILFQLLPQTSFFQIWSICAILALVSSIISSLSKEKS